MSVKIYSSARGKTVDMGALRLKNEQVRAVGNMGVNARGDRIDSQGNIIDPKNQQTERRIQRQTNVQDIPTHTSVKTAAAAQAQSIADLLAFPDLPQDDEVFTDPIPAQPQQQQILAPVIPVVAPEPVAVELLAIEPVMAKPKEVIDDVNGGLAAAIARAKTVKQELEKTVREQQKTKPIRKI
jgi:hypothetical protein